MSIVFSILFFSSLISIVFHRTIWLKIFALASILVAGFYTQTIFEYILEIVIFAVILSEDEDANITQILFVITSSILLIDATNLLSFVIAFEVLSLVSVILVSYAKTKEQIKGAIKLYIASAISTAFIFLGLMFYSIGGGELMKPISTTPNHFELIGIFILLAGAFYKLTIVPFHSWAIDTYALVRHSSGAVLSGVIKSVVAFSLFQLVAPFLDAQLQLSNNILIPLAIITMTLGNFLALFEKRLAKIFSYSSIAHAGYMLLIFVAVRSEFSHIGVLYMTVAYMFMQTASFLILDILRDRYSIKTLEDLKGFSTQHKTLSALFSIQILSLSGIPLLAGFLAKAVVFYALVDSGYWVVALIALLNSALSVGYYIWILKSIYFDTNQKPKILISIPNKILAQAILASGTIYFGILAGGLF